MSELYLDSTALIYAWNSEGREILGAYFAYARSAGYEIVTTDIVGQELIGGTSPRYDVISCD